MGRRSTDRIGLPSEVSEAAEARSAQSAHWPLVGLWAGMIGLGVWIAAALAIPGVIRLRRVLTVSAPVEDVFDFWRKFQNFPKFMSFIEKVELNEAGGFRWTLCGPARVRFEWDAELVRLIPNREIRWSSLPGSVLKHSGRVLMRELRPGRTEVSVDLDYAIPAGVLGYGATRLLGFDPRKRIDDDLLRMKRLIEESSTVAEMRLG